MNNATLDFILVFCFCFVGFILHIYTYIRRCLTKTCVVNMESMCYRHIIDNANVNLNIMHEDLYINRKYFGVLSSFYKKC